MADVKKKYRQVSLLAGTFISLGQITTQTNTGLGVQPIIVSIKIMYTYTVKIAIFAVFLFLLFLQILNYILCKPFSYFSYINSPLINSII
jgi:hypothetical protein